jgi:hypothetical protein
LLVRGLRWPLVAVVVCAGLVAPTVPASAALPSRTLATTHLSFTGFDAELPAGATISVIQRCPQGSALDKAATRERYPDLDAQLQGEPNVRLSSRELWVAGLVSRYRVVRRGGVPTQDGFGLANIAVCTTRVAAAATTLTGGASTDVRVWNRAPAGVQLFSFTGVSVQDAGRPSELPYLSAMRATGVAPSRGALPSGVRAVQEAQNESGLGLVGVTGTTLRPVTPGRFVSMSSDYSFTTDLTRRMPHPEAPETLPITVEGRTAEGGQCTVEPDEVAAGEHEITFIALDGPSSVALRDGSGQIVFQREAQRQEIPPGEGEEGEIPFGVSEPAVASLAAGTYTVECAPVGGSVTTAELQVVPARTGAL